MHNIDYHIYFTKSPIGLWRTKIDNGQFVAANPATAKILGCQTVEDLLKFRSTDFYINGDRQHLIEEIMKKGNVHNYELQVVKRDGTKIWLSVTARKEDGFIEGSIEDITDRKSVESYLESCQVVEGKRLEELQKSLRKKIKDISVSIISDRHNS